MAMNLMDPVALRCYAVCSALLSSFPKSIDAGKAASNERHMVVVDAHPLQSLRYIQLCSGIHLANLLTNGRLMSYNLIYTLQILHHPFRRQKYCFFFFLSLNFHPPRSFRFQIARVN